MRIAFLRAERKVGLSTSIACTAYILSKRHVVSVVDHDSRLLEFFKPERDGTTEFHNLYVLPPHLEGSIDADFELLDLPPITMIEEASKYRYDTALTAIPLDGRDIHEDTLELLGLSHNKWFATLALDEIGVKLTRRVFNTPISVIHFSPAIYALWQEGFLPAACEEIVEKDELEGFRKLARVIERIRS